MENRRNTPSSGLEPSSLMPRLNWYGTLPLEMARGSRALHYHLYALAAGSSGRIWRGKPYGSLRSGKWSGSSSREYLRSRHSGSRSLRQGHKRTARGSKDDQRRPDRLGAPLREALSKPNAGAHDPGCAEPERLLPWRSPAQHMRSPEFFSGSFNESPAAFCGRKYYRIRTRDSCEGGTPGNSFRSCLGYAIP
jgi:hypothetical protein